EPDCPPGCWWREACARQHAGRSWRLRACGRRRARNYRPAASTTGELQRLQHRDGPYNASGQSRGLGGREVSWFPCRDQRRRGRRHRAGPLPNRRHVGRLRYLPDPRGAGLEAEARARSSACLYGLDCGRRYCRGARECRSRELNPPDPYPRDLIGYAGDPPDPRWPGGSRIAVSLVLNYEEGGERNILHGDTHSESVLTDLGGEPLVKTRNLNVESNFEYGSRVGFWEIMRILRERQVAATVYAVGMALERNAPAAAELAASGLEVACHGQRWIDYHGVPESVEREDILKNIEVVTRLI